MAANETNTENAIPVDDAPTTADDVSLPAEVPPHTDPSAWSLKHPLSKVQAIVGIAAGLISVFGVVVPLAGNIRIPVSGEFVGVVQQASREPVLDAAVEIATSQNAIITTLASRENGQVHLPLKEGQYRIRVLHPDFVPEVRRVQVIGGQSSEVHIVLTPRVVPPPPAPVAPVVPVVIVSPVPTKPAKRPGAVREPTRRDARPQTP
jgi:hypothetical protein